MKITLERVNLNIPILLTDDDAKVVILPPWEMEFPPCAQPQPSPVTPVQDEQSKYTRSYF